VTPRGVPRLDEEATIRNLSAAQSARERREFFASQEDPRAGRFELAVPGTDTTVEDFVEGLARGFEERVTLPVAERASGFGDVIAAVSDDPGILGDVRIEADEESGGIVLPGVEEGTPEGRAFGTFGASVVSLANVPRAAREIDELAVEPTIEVLTGGPIGEAPERADEALGVGEREAREIFDEFFVADVSEERLEMLRSGDLGDVEDEPLISFDVRPGREPEVGGAAAAGLASLFLSAGAIGAASRAGGPRAGRAVSFGIQPGEELVFEGFRRGAVPRSLARRVPGVSDERLDFGSPGAEIRSSRDFRIGGSDGPRRPLGAGLGGLAAELTAPETRRIELETDLERPRPRSESDLAEEARRIEVEFEGEFDRRVPTETEIRESRNELRAENPFTAEGEFNVPRDPLEAEPLPDVVDLVGEGELLGELVGEGERLGEITLERELEDVAEIEAPREVEGLAETELTGERELETLLETELTQEPRLEPELLLESELRGESAVPEFSEPEREEGLRRFPRFLETDEVFSSGFTDPEALLDDV
jgi:hypothetical protein